MDELLVNIDSQQHSIQTNFDTITEQLQQFLEGYKDLVVDENSIKESKADLANLRKLRTEIEDKRKSVKKEWNKPYADFEAECKKLTAMIDVPIGQLDVQLKMFAEERIAKKRDHVREIYEAKVGELAKFLPFEKIYLPVWDNVSCKDSDVEFDLSGMVLKVKNDLQAIESLNSEIKDEVIQTYIDSGNDLAKAIARNSQFLSDKARVEAQAKEIEKPVEEKPAEKNNLTSLNDFIKMTQSVKIIISVDDLPQVKELLDFSEIKYTVEGE